jgi:hypothetical protein
MNYARQTHSCAMIRKDDRNPSLSVIAVGGENNGDFKNSVEILDANTSVWRLGHNLPVATWRASLIEDPRGGVILVGGVTSSGLTTSLYRLKHAGLFAQWELMTQKLKLGNSYFAAFFVPDRLVQNCTFS